MPRNSRLLAAGAALAAALCGCVDLPTVQSTQEERQAVRLPQTLDLGLQSQETLHFLVKSYTRETAVVYGDKAEKLYQQLMQYTGLYSFVPKQPYELLIYQDRQEYLSKTGSPEWSGGVTMGNAIVVYDSPQAAAVIAHEMTHLIFNEYMEKPRQDLTWLNEGLAVAMEKKNYPAEQLVSYETSCSSALQYGAVPLTSLIASTPLKEDRRNAQAWYCQANSVVSFMLDKGGGIGFSVLAGKLKTGSQLDDALNTAYNGLWTSAAALEKDWMAASGVNSNARATGF